MREREQAGWERLAYPVLMVLLGPPGLLLLLLLGLSSVARLVQSGVEGGAGRLDWAPGMAVALGISLLLMRSLWREWRMRSSWDYLPPSRGWEPLLYGLAAGTFALPPAMHAGAAVRGHFPLLSPGGEALLILALLFLLGRPLERRLRRLWRQLFESSLNPGPGFWKEMGPLLRPWWPAGVLLLVLPGLAVLSLQGVLPLPRAPRWLSEGGGYLVFLALLGQAGGSSWLIDSLRRLLLSGGGGFRLASGASEARLLFVLFLPLPLLLLTTLPFLGPRTLAWTMVLLAPLFLLAGALSLWGRLLLEGGCLRSLPLSHYRLRAPDGTVSLVRGGGEGTLPARCWEPGAELERISRLRYAQEVRARRTEGNPSDREPALLERLLFFPLARIPGAARALQGWEANAWLCQCLTLPAPLRAQALERLLVEAREEALCYLVEFPELAPHLSLASWTSFLGTPEAAGRLEVMRLYAERSEKNPQAVEMSR